jgi:DNA-binding response OmpR family regulator
MASKSPIEYTILLLISEPLVRQVTREALAHAGYTVLATGDLGTAVDRMSESKPDLLIVAPYVETIPGHQAAKYLQSRSPGMPLLMLAGIMADDRLQNRAELEGMDVFPQPFTAAQLLQKVGSILSEPR